MTDLRRLRQDMRALRRTLSDGERSYANDLLCKRVSQLRIFEKSQNLATYLAFEGEPDPQTLLEQATCLGKVCYLPVLVAKKQPMLFAPYRPGDALKMNWFNIPEPDVARSEMITPQQLDLVLTPLVAFDSQANRLGVGGGYYDRSFAFININPQATRPVLLGLAFELQKVAALPRRAWDVPLDGIATEKRLYYGNNGIVLE
jgi:5-formyltetrahydrofolate cyclo-ligase